MVSVIRLTSPAARQAAMRQISQAPEGYVCIVKEATRSLEANARLHAMLTDIRNQCEYMGKRRTVEFWKGLFVSGWQIATGQSPEIVPGLEGEFINIRESTATMSGKKIWSVMDYVEAWAVDNGVRFSAREAA